MASQEGLTVTKSENFSEWYTQLITKAELIEYTDVSGCYILRPRSYAIWEAVQAYFDKKIKADGVKNASFPLFIPESLLTKESEHVEGFAPEVAWVTHGGNSELGERLAVRPTSETIMYAAYAKWIRSYKDLPLRLNQWCSVVRWEFANPTPFLRSREFLWQEGHTAYATQAEAEAEVRTILGFYEDLYREVYAIPTLAGCKAKTETFAGADYSLSLEAFMPNGKAIQACTSHHLGQGFAKAFDVTFTDKEERQQYVWQNSWGLTTRSIGMMLMLHSDDKGLVLPPRVASEKVVLVPILVKGKEDLVLEKATYVCRQLKDFGCFVDDRTAYRPGWKFSEWELKGIPLRLELGPRDLANDSVVAVRRDTGEKVSLPLAQLKKKVDELLSSMQRDLYARAKEFLDASIVAVATWDAFEKAISEQKLVYAPWCTQSSCEEHIKHKLGGVKSLNTPLDAQLTSEKCAHCGEKALAMFYFGRSY